MSVDNSREEFWRAMQVRHSQPIPESAALKGGRGGGTYDGMEGRVSKLEAYCEETRNDMREIRGDLKAIIGLLGTLPSKSDMATWKWQWLAVSFAAFAIIVTGLVGGLAWVAALTTH